jgi:L-amino acid N-acyltransferase YncA
MHFDWPSRLTDSDKEQMLAILNAVAGKEGTNGIPRPFTVAEGDAFAAALDGAMSRGECYQLFAREEEGGRIRAFATIEPVKMNPARAHVIEVKRMAADPAARGFGGYLVEGWRAILHKCEELDRDLICIDVSEDGPYRLWQKLGFRVYAKMADYARVGTRKLDGYYLSVYVVEAHEALERFRGDSRRSPIAASSPATSTASPK